MHPINPVLLLLLAAALPAPADDLDSKRAELAKLMGRAWELRGKRGEESRDVATKVAAMLKDLYPHLADPEAIELRFQGATSPEDHGSDQAGWGRTQVGDSGPRASRRVRCA